MFTKNRVGHWHQRIQRGVARHAGQQDASVHGLSRDRVWRVARPSYSAQCPRGNNGDRIIVLSEVGGAAAKSPLGVPAQWICLRAANFACYRVHIALELGAGLLARIRMRIRLLPFLINVCKGYRVYFVSRKNILSLSRTSFSNSFCSSFGSGMGPGREKGASERAKTDEAKVRSWQGTRSATFEENVRNIA